MLNLLYVFCFTFVCFIRVLVTPSNNFANKSVERNGLIGHVRAPSIRVWASLRHKALEY